MARDGLYNPIQTHSYGTACVLPDVPLIFSSRQVFHSVSEIHKGRLHHLLHRTDYDWRTDTAWLAVQDSHP